MFVPLELAAEIERVEAEFLREIVAGTQRRRPQLQAWSTAIAGGMAAYAGADAPVNKIVGLGFGGVPDADAFAAVEQRYRAVGCPVVIELSTYGDPAVLAFLGDRGYRLAAFEDVVGLQLARSETGSAPAAASRSGAAIDVAVVVDGSQREAWFESLVEGFAVPDGQGVAAQNDFPREVVGGMMRDMATVAGYSTWLAQIGGEPVGGGALHVAGRIAHLCGAATVPAFRRRGVQTRLVGERLHAAAQAGCELALTVTQAGSKSQQNMKRHGFELLFSRAVMTRPV